MTQSPFDGADVPAEANEADVAEQQQSLGDEETVTPTRVPLDEANEADVLEQGAEVGEDDEYDR
jgi:hypothetical protein